MVVIKNMDHIPKECKSCPAYVCYMEYAGDPGVKFCGITKDDTPRHGIPDWCPLEEEDKI